MDIMSAINKKSLRMISQLIERQLESLTTILVKSSTELWAKRKRTLKTFKVLKCRSLHACCSSIITIRAKTVSHTKIVQTKLNISRCIKKKTWCFSNWVNSKMEAQISNKKQEQQTLKIRPNHSLALWRLINSKCMLGIWQDNRLQITSTISRVC